MAARCRRGTHACGLRTADAATALGLTRSLSLNCYGLRIDLMDIEETEAAPPQGASGRKLLGGPENGHEIDLNLELASGVNFKLRSVPSRWSGSRGQVRPGNDRKRLEVGAGLGAKFGRTMSENVTPPKPQL